jgi:hypothetical protein
MFEGKSEYLKRNGSIEKIPASISQNRGAKK